MTEVDVTGINAITYPYVATWHWHVALYLFIGGLVAGLMIFGPLFRLMNMKGFTKAVLISDIVGLPLLATGMFFLWIDLARRWNAWRFFTTFQITSAMSWGSWILLFCMIVLCLRLLTRVPMPPSTTSTRRLDRIWQSLWRVMAQIGQQVNRRKKSVDILTILLGAALGLYTGVLLNTIPARPLWNTSTLPFLFLASGLASGWALLGLLVSSDRIRKLAPIPLALGAVELALILSYVLTLSSGSEAARRAGELLVSGTYGFGLWGLVVLVGLLIPVSIETMELTRGHLPQLVTRFAPVLTLIGGLSLRFVIVYAGLHSYV